MARMMATGRAMLDRLREQLGLGGHETEFADLHPFQQTRAANNISVLEDLVNTDYWQLPDELKINPVRLKAWYACSGWDGNQEAKEKLQTALDTVGHDQKQHRRWLFGSWKIAKTAGDEQTTENFVLFTVPSKTSARTAVILSWLRANDAGAPDWNTAGSVVVRVCDDLDEAVAWIDAIPRAMYGLTQVRRTLLDQRTEAFGRYKEAQFETDF